MVANDAAQPGATSTCSSRSTSGSIAAASTPEAPGAAEFVARVAELPGLSLRGLLSHAGHAYGATSDAETASIAAAEARLLRRCRDKVGERG